MNHIIETEIATGEDELGENKSLKNPFSFLVENLAGNETYSHLLLFKVTSIDGSFELKKTEHQGYSNDRVTRSIYKKGFSNGLGITPNGKFTGVKKTVTLYDLVVNRQIYIFLNALLYTVIYIIIHYLM